MLVPAEAAGTNTPNLLIGSGKSGNIYLLNMTNLGDYNTDGNNNQIVQSVAGQMAEIWSSPVYFDHLDVLSNRAVR